MRSGHLKQTPWSAGVLGKYLLLQVPSWALLALGLLIASRWIDIPPWLFAAVVGGWVGKDLLLYPLVWRAYASGASVPGRPSRDSRGIVVRELAPSGYVEVEGELWRAEIFEGRETIPEGKRVRVRDVRGMTLLVEPIREE